LQTTAHRISVPQSCKKKLNQAILKHHIIAAEWIR